MKCSDLGALCGFHRHKHSFYPLQRGDPNPEIVKLEAIMRAMNEKYKAHSSTLVHKVFVPKSGTIVKNVNDQSDDFDRACQSLVPLLRDNRYSVG